MSVEKYLKPEVINQIKRLDLRAQFVVKGFLHGLHASPFHGFSVEFSEHRKYTAGDDPKDIDWQVYAKTDKYYVKKFESETNITGYLVMDLSQSMGYTYRQELTKFDYGICLAAALAYLMISQQDPVGLVTFNEKVRESLPPRSKRTQLANVLSLLSRLKPNGTTDLKHSLGQLTAMLKTRSLVMIFSDLLVDERAINRSPPSFASRGARCHSVSYPGRSRSQFSVSRHLRNDGSRDRRRDQDRCRRVSRRVHQAGGKISKSAGRQMPRSGIDYVPLDTSMQFDKALLEYLHSRRARG